MTEPDATTHVTVEGAGRPVVLVHGVLVDHRMWDPQADGLAGDYRIIRYDLLGHGQSLDPPGERRLGDFVDQLRGVIAEHCPAERPVLVGFSMGGLIVQAFAVDHSAEIAGLVIMNAVYDRTPDERAAVGVRLAALEQRGMESVIEAAMSRWFTAAEQRDEAVAIGRIVGLLRSGDENSKRKAYRVFATSDGETAGRLGAIVCPALVMTGDGDVGSPPHMAEKMAREIPNAQLRILAGQQHMMPTLAAELVNRRLRDFIGGL